MKLNQSTSTNRRITFKEWAVYDFLARNIDNERFDELLKIIQKDECVVFTGAGLSKPLGYRAWAEGIIESEDSTPTLIQLAGISKDEALKYSLSEIVDRCREILGDKYFTFLMNEFGTENKDKHHANLFLLWKSNFQHYITTNFDESLYNNRENCNNLVTYPSPDLVIHPNRTLYYLHSRAFVAAGEINPTLNYYLENIVYGKKSYLEAYSDEGAIESFIYNIIQKYSILFIGFSMADEDFKNTYEKMRKRWERYSKKIRRHPQRQNENIKTHYILLSYPMKSKYDNESDYQKEIDAFNYKERKLKEININVISYKISAERERKGLTKALGVVMDRAPQKILSELGELGVEAAYSGSANENKVTK